MKPSVAEKSYIFCCLFILLIAFSTGSAAAKLLDDFEDGDITSDPQWEGDTGSSSTTTSPVKQGTYSLDVSWCCGDKSDIYTDITNAKIENFTVYLYNPNNAFSHSAKGRLETDSGTDIINFDYNAEQNEFRVCGNSKSSTNSNTWVKVEFLNIDYSSYEIGEVRHEGSTVASNVAFCNNHDIVGRFGLGGGSGSGNSVYFDNVTYSVQNTAPTYESVSTSPETWMSEESVKVEANISDDGSVSSVSGTVYEDGVPTVTDASFTQDANGNWSASNLFTADSGDAEYKVELNATDDSGSSTVQNVTSKTTGNLSLSWSHPGSPDGYKVYSNVSGSMNQIADVPSSNYEHVSTAISSGDYICYEVTAYNSYGESNPTPEDCATVP